MFGTVRENDENKSSPLPVTWFNSKTPILHKKDVRIEKKKLLVGFILIHHLNACTYYLTIMKTYYFVNMIIRIILPISL